jgi:hypothetical protein
MESFPEENSRSKKLNDVKIPKAVPFILFNILLERYSTTGISGEALWKL